PKGAIVTVTDLADENTLADSLAMLADVPIAAAHLGGHREEDFRYADLVVVNPAVRPDSPWLDTARRAGATLRTEIELFVENCPARIVGVTGSTGKSTTAAMIAEILRCQGGQSHFRGEDAGLTGDVSLAAKIGTVPNASRTFLGGNIGGSLLDQLPQIGRDDWVVLELSSFQLRHFSPAAKSPHIAVVTGCTPNHLDWHRSFADYAAAKQRILAGQTPDDFAVLNARDAKVASWRPLVRGHLVSPPELDDLPPLAVPGEHNRINAACAAAAAMAAGCENGGVRQGLRRFVGLPQRLECVADITGRRLYNDSASTTPESTVAALRSLDVPVWLLAGGAAKGCDFGPLAAEIVRRARGAAFFGDVREKLIERVASINRQFPCIAVETLDEALQWCWMRCRSGEAIVLSPGCAGTDQFCNYRRRGEHFVELVGRLHNP
ncbi:MAG: UDP-N-acetylmuramoyl-L-alanine--D-glutamate ligase, partial [Pirellulales bacterium]|nr:UDP-N-acetylmuramoyl-L-alanine--D-glutamate ligase [Pirellulales bacterium]